MSYLGIDCSTQSLKLVLLSSSSDLLETHVISYAHDLPHYATIDGVHKTGAVVTSPSNMFVEALERGLQLLRAGKYNVKEIEAISVSGQQHGSVWCRNGFEKRWEDISKSQKDVVLHEITKSAFSLENSPIWMDSSTREECRAIEEFVAEKGGSVVQLSGSRCYERFTGPQIRKYMIANPREVSDTERICLISSFIPSLFVGKYVGIDFGDGSGMNLMDINTCEWSSLLLDATCAGTAFTQNELTKKLGCLVSPNSTVGTVSPLFQHLFGFSSTCKVIASSGDNICALAAMGLNASGDVGISLGTSDTIFAVLEKPTLQANVSIGHIFRHPLIETAYMALLCFKNGSLARENVRNTSTGASWDGFNAALTTSKPNLEHMGLYFFEPEITPTLSKSVVARFKCEESEPNSFSKFTPCALFSVEEEVRSLIESQIMNMKYHVEKIGLKTPKRIIVTGGASQNMSIIQVISDVFGAPVYRCESAQSAAVGAALRAKHACSNGQNLESNELHVAAKPNLEYTSLYIQKQKLYEQMQEQLL